MTVTKIVFFSLYILASILFLFRMNKYLKYFELAIYSLDYVIIFGIMLEIRIRTISLRIYLNSRFDIFIF